MAFTPEQEAGILDMLTAFQDGKRLTDLPEAEGGDLEALTFEVVEGGESKKLNGTKLTMSGNAIVEALNALDSITITKPTRFTGGLKKTDNV